MDYPPFTDAIARFRSFLNDEEQRGPIGWVFPSDVLWVKGWIIRPRPQGIVIEEVAKAYEDAIARRLGVKLGVLCLVGATLWCYIYCPRDQLDAEYAMMPDGLKLSVPSPLHVSGRVVDDAEWEYLQPMDLVEHRQRIFM